ncbi:hypothetical protein Tco_1449552 [Tanacetum coccineum]
MGERGKDGKITKAEGQLGDRERRSKARSWERGRYRAEGHWFWKRRKGQEKLKPKSTKKDGQANKNLVKTPNKTLDPEGGQEQRMNNIDDEERKKGEDKRRWEGGEKGKREKQEKKRGTEGERRKGVRGGQGGVGGEKARNQIEEKASGKQEAKDRSGAKRGWVGRGMAGRLGGRKVGKIERWREEEEGKEGEGEKKEEKK